MNIYVFLLCVCALGITAYSNTFLSPFEFDDIATIVNNPLIDINNLVNLWFWQPGRFLVNLTFVLNATLSHSVVGFHIVNLMLHLINGLLVYLCIELVIRCITDTYTEKTRQWMATICALVFVLHPIQTQAVTYIVQRTTVLATTFFLSALILYCEFLITKTKHRWVIYLFSLVFMVFAHLTKENTFTFAFVIFILEIIRRKKQILHTLPYLLVSIIVYFSLFLIGQPYVSVKTFLPSFTASQIYHISRSVYALTQIHVVNTYMRLMLFPVKQNLDYDYPLAKRLFTIPTIFALLFLISIFVFTLYMRRRYSLVAFGILFFFATLVVESSILPIDDVIAEHRLYLPSIGFILSVIAGFTVLVKKRNMRIVFGSVVLIMLLVMTYLRNQVWRDEVTLWTDVVSKSPQKARSHYTLATVLLEKKNYTQAREELLRATVLRPTYHEAYANLGVVYSVLNDNAKAEDAYKRSLEILPNYAAANNLGSLYREEGKYEEAISVLRAVLDHPLPGYHGGIPFEEVYAHLNLGLAYGKLGNTELEKTELYKTLDLAKKAGIEDQISNTVMELLGPLGDD